MVELELKDWKDVEISAISQIRQSMIQYQVGLEILNLAKINIIRMGGSCESATLRGDNGKVE